MDNLKICKHEDLIEYAPVVQGKWINAYIGGVHHYRCSECGEYTEAVWHANFVYNFCPNCGARMDGGADNG